MHDIDRAGNSTAARLAALTALRNAQAEGAQGEGDAASDPGQHRAHDGRGRHPRAPAPKSGAASSQAESTSTRQDVSGGVYAAVEAAVKRSRVEFMARLSEYQRTIDCEAFKAAGPDGPGASLDDAQFVAHRIAGVGKTLGFADLGDTARLAEVAITAYKRDNSADLHQAAVSRVCKLMALIEATCAEYDACQV